MNPHFSHRHLLTIIFFFVIVTACQDEPPLQSASYTGSSSEALILNQNESNESNASIGELIPLEEAIALTDTYQSNNPDQPAALFIGTDAMQQLLDLPNMVAIRWIFGYTSSSELSVIIEPLIEAADGSMYGDSDHLLQAYQPSGYESSSPLFHGEETEAPTISPSDGLAISLDDAQSMVDAYIAGTGEGRALIQGRTLLETLLTHQSTPGLWLYIGQDAIANQEILATPSNVGNTTPSYPVADRSTVCPPFCPPGFTSEIVL
uniref:Uncharacterized protein n=1 Tax=Roseihalotalea indica TaxID=2867963 RepID=A0AA49GKP1_9BACT|nr:hypothetical protein K4G66_30045 [Tunicatimonas sp. TK19036]